MSPAPDAKSPLLTVVCPSYDEIEVIGLFYSELSAVLQGLEGLRYEIVFVEDGGSDGTLEKLNEIAEVDSRVRVFSLSRNFGHQVALSAGLDVARGDAVVMMDCDLQHPPVLIPQMVALWAQGYDVVSTVRTASRGTPWSKRATSRAFYWAINRLSDTEVVPGASDFCLLSRRAVESLGKMPERHRFLRGMVAWLGFRRTFLPFEAPERGAGTSKYSWTRMVSFALDAIFSFSAAPLKLATKMGLAVAVAGIAYLGYILVRFFVLGDLVEGWASILSAVLILGGVQLAFVGLIGEYLARVFEEGKERPLYLLRQTPSADAQ